MVHSIPHSMSGIFNKAPVLFQPNFFLPRSVSMSDLVKFSCLLKHAFHFQTGREGSFLLCAHEIAVGIAERPFRALFCQQSCVRFGAQSAPEPFGASQSRADPENPVKPKDDFYFPTVNVTW